MSVVRAGSDPVAVRAPTTLIERAAHLAALTELLEQTADAGRLVLISGEAGVGKSALVEELLAHHVDGARVLIGRCDDLFAPLPLGPLADMARGRPGPLAEALAAGDQAAAFDAFLTELASSPHPTVVVFEDLQWADEATLDLLRFVARRLDALPCLVLATHRADLPREHPMRRAWGSLVGPLVSRIHLQPLSLAAVRTLVAGTGVDAESLHAQTGGNPFFITEVLDGVPGTLPETIRDAVFARAAHLSGSARDALDAAAVLGRQVSADLIQVVGDCRADAIDECVAAGLLVDTGGHQTFRHELSRQAVDDAMTPLRRRQLHARALDALGDQGDVVWRAHHAIGAGEPDAIRQLATQAAEHCVALGAFRQAATLYGRALEHADGLPDADRLGLLKARAQICDRIEQPDEAVRAGEEALALIEATGDEAALGEWESWLSCTYRSAGRGEDSWRMLQRSVARLEPLGDSPALAQALAHLSGHQMVAGLFADGITNGRRSHVLAERFGLESVAIYTMEVVGTCLGCSGDAGEGIALQREALDRAKRGRLPQEIALTSANLSSVLVGIGEPAAALPILDDGIAVAEEHELRYRRNCMLLARAEVYVLLGRWDEAVADAAAILAQPELSDTNRCFALLHTGHVRALRGDPGAVEALEESLVLAQAASEAQLIFPVRMALAEAAWVRGDLERSAAEVGAATSLADRLDPFSRRELALWARRTGVAWTPVGPLAEPAERVLAGDARGVAAFWDERRCPYPAADALGDSDDLDDLRQAFDRLTALGARPRAQQVARRLRDLGARDVPRGPRASTRSNAAGLTAREVEVAALLVDGLTNADIARRLVLSPKTVDHHVSAVLAKLAAPTRRQVASAAAALGVELKDGVANAPT